MGPTPAEKKKARPPNHPRIQAERCSPANYREKENTHKQKGQQGTKPPQEGKQGPTTTTKTEREDTPETGKEGNAQTTPKQEESTCPQPPQKEKEDKAHTPPKQRRTVRQQTTPKREEGHPQKEGQQGSQQLQTQKESKAQQPPKIRERRAKSPQKDKEDKEPTHRHPARMAFVWRGVYAGPSGKGALRGGTSCKCKFLQKS